MRRVDEENRNVAGIYCRVSTKEQVSGYSLDEQKRICRDYLHNIGIKYYRLYMDEGSTGKNLNRPGLQEMLDDCLHGKITHVIVWKLDRLSRNFNDSVLLAADLNEMGIEIISVTQRIDTTTTIGKMILSIYAGNAEMEVKNLTERISIGLRARWKEGKWKGGTTAYGYDFDEATEMLVINKEEAKVVKLIFKKYLKLGTIRSVSNYLNEKGMTTRKGNKWRDTSIGAILSRKTYVGILQQGDVKVISEDLRIIDDKTFQKAQKQREDRKVYSPKKEKVELIVGEKFCHNCGVMLFEEMVYCSECGVRQERAMI